MRAPPKMQLILGIDPGSQVTGYGLLNASGAEVQHLEHGVLVAPAKASFNERLQVIGDQLSELFLRFKPQVTVVEKIFLGRNADSAFKLGHIRGVCMLMAGRANSQIVEYATRSVKKGITGNGASTKEQVQMILFATLRIHEAARADASDALALAYYHARNIEVEENLRRGQRHLARESM